MNINEKKSFDVIVIGGGAAGMMAAITAASNGADTMILEHKDRVGKKILSTGNGKYKVVVSEASDYVKERMQEMVERAEAIHRGVVDPKDK